MGTIPRPGSSEERRVLVTMREADLVIVVAGQPAAVAALIEALRRPRQAILGSPVPRSASVGQSTDSRPVSGDGLLTELTGQQAAVAALVSRALTNRQIANRLRISPHTVNFHLRQIYRKLSINSRVHLATLAHADPIGAD